MAHQLYKILYKITDYRFELCLLLIIPMVNKKSLIALKFVDKNTDPGIFRP